MHQATIELDAAEILSVWLGHRGTGDLMAHRDVLRLGTQTEAIAVEIVGNYRDLQALGVKIAEALAVYDQA